MSDAGQLIKNNFARAKFRNDQFNKLLSIVLSKSRHDFIF